MDTIDKFVKQQLENNLQIQLNKTNDYFKGIESDSSKLSMKALYNHFKEKENKSLEETSKEELIDLIRSKQ